MFLFEIFILFTDCFPCLALCWEPDIEDMPVKPEVRLNNMGPAKAVPGPGCLMTVRPPTPPAAVAVWEEIAPPERSEMPLAPYIAWVAELPPSM